MLGTTLIAACCAMLPMQEGGKYNPVLSIGDQGPAWEELMGIDEQRHSLSDLDEFAAVVVIFTCNSCPYAVDYEDRINALHASCVSRNIAVVAINVNTNDQDNLAAMQRRAREKQFQFPYLYDDSQQIALDYGATYTPEFFVLDDERKIVYMGAMDDNTSEDEVETNYVGLAIDAALAGEAPEVAETIAIGCRIRMNRRRR